jgi:DNA-binding transcriptional ArsR family regulator/uncharacterized protein YndB with AHSA1/START domain
MAAYPGMDDIFRALADPTRRRLLDSLNARNGQTLRELSSELDMTRQSVSKHLAVLEAASLVTSIRRGREKLHYLNAAPINEIGERWITRYELGRVEALADLKRALEDTTMTKPSFVYTTYIRTTPESLWKALTDPAFTKRYWGLTLESDWSAGSPVIWEQLGVKIADPDQVVLESDPYRRLAYTWHTFTPAVVESLDLTADVAQQVAAEPRSKVTFDLEPVGEVVKLTVVHDGFEEDSIVATMVTGGWPRVLSNLKTFLESGEPLPKTTEPRVPVSLGLTARHKTRHD